MMRAILFFLLAGGLLIARPSAPVAMAQTTAPFELGGQVLSFLNTQEMRNAGMTWLKMQITWARGGSTADAQNVITHARNHGFKVLLSVKGLKAELAANPAQYYQDFAGFLAQVAVLNPDAIEVWNEPNIDQEWPVGLISGTAYAQMLARAYPAIKAANAGVLVISGAPAPTGYFGGICTANGCDDRIFIEQMAAQGAAANFDCTGIHYNEGVLPPTASSGDPRGNPNHYTRYYPTMVSTYRQVFPNRPLCFTELGYVSPDGLGGLPVGLEWGLNTSAQEQADWLALAAKLSREGGVVRLMIVWNVNASFTPSNPMAGWAIVRDGGRCLPCATLPGALLDRTAAPDLNYFTTGAVRLSWNRVTGATAYAIQVADNRMFNGIPDHEDTLMADVLEITTPPLSAGRHYWRIRARLADSSWGPWSATGSFTIGTP